MRLRSDKSATELTPSPTSRPHSALVAARLCKTLSGERESMMKRIAKPLQIQKRLIFSIQKIQNRR
ncbi:hypothetical protein V2K57_15660 [Pseudomonas alliivorans]|nr:hypothetical protein [Pseudomonas alliivorans]MEE4635368.1 hypothetical protein [Pseudomonas alliivorans]MEE4650435.1 hypothetical protein [Pseudomonas alliivorans]MEE4675902.1 hypothetical protein [Pseudomonas alliivorans]MEE4681631.1 hypothetical protein [Pseudomonas alliivorans]